MDWIIRHHLGVLLWIVAVSALSTSTICYHSPVMGIVCKALGIVFITAGILEVRNED